MSADERQTLADAVAAVPGLNCSPTYRQNLKAGEGVVRLEGVRPDGSGIGFLNVWQILLALPQGIADAETYLDAHLDALLIALDPVLAVTNVQQKTLILDNAAGAVPVVVVEGTRARPIT